MTSKTEQAGQQERSPADFAIEHAGYLANAARDFITAVNAEAGARMDDEEFGSASSMNALDMAMGATSEAQRRLSAAIYEFEKRRDRAAVSSLSAGGATPSQAAQEGATELLRKAAAVMDALMRISNPQLDRNAEFFAVGQWKAAAFGGGAYCDPLECLSMSANVSAPPPAAAAVEAVPGLKLVPVEVTREMLERAEKRWHYSQSWETASDCYSALVAAAPAPTPAVPVEAKQEPTVPKRWQWRRFGERAWRDGPMPSSALGETGTYEVRGTFFASPTAGTPAAAVPPMEPDDFTPTSRKALAWVLWHHQGASSDVGQAVRFALGMDATERMPDWLVADAKAWAGLKSAAPAAPAPLAELTDERVLELRSKYGWAKETIRAIEREVRSTSPSVQVPSAGTAVAVPTCIQVSEQSPENKAFWHGVEWGRAGVAAMVPSDWLAPGAVVPVTQETVSQLLNVVRILAGGTE